MKSYTKQKSRPNALITLIIMLLALGNITTKAQTQNNPLPIATPDSQGIPQAKIDELTATLENYLSQNMFVGAECVIIKNNNLIYQKSFGLRDKKKNLPYTNNTICNIRSMTKSITGAAAQILIDRKQLALDDKVAEYIPSFDNDTHREITIEQLLTHRSGLPRTAITQSMRQYDSLQSLASAAGNLDLLHKPGSQFSDSDAGSDVLAAIIEKITEIPLNEFVKKEIFQPLGMTNSFYAFNASDPRFNQIANLYLGTAIAWKQYWSPEVGPYYPFAWGSQSICGTPLDYAKFLAMWMNDGKVNDKQILSPEAIKRTLTPVSPMTMLGTTQPFPNEYPDLTIYYGQMSMLYMPTTDPLNSKPSIIGYSGEDGTIAWAWPNENLIALLYTQSRGGVSNLRIEPVIDKLIIHPNRKIIAEEIPEKYKPYVGTYIANFATFKNTEFVVRMHHDKLAIDIPAQQIFDLLEPDEKGRWKFALMPNQVAVSFGRDDNNVVNLLQIHQRGATVDLPRKGSKLEEYLANLPENNPEAAAKLLATFHTDIGNRNLTTYLDGDVLCIKLEDHTLHLRATTDPLRWKVKETPGIIIKFTLNEEQTQAISLTQIAGDITTPWKRIEPTTTDSPNDKNNQTDDDG